MHKILFYNKFISCLYMFRAHVLETCRGIKYTYCKTKFSASSWLITEVNIVHVFRKKIVLSTRNYITPTSYPLVNVCLL